MSDLYICIDCELANANADPTSLNEHGMCPRCGSSSVVPVDTLLELDAKAKAAKQAPPSGTPDYAERAKAMRLRRREDNEPLRKWLTSLLDNHRSSTEVCWCTELTQALAEWDGWAWELHYPWEPASLDSNCFAVELINGVKNGPRWLIKIDATLVDVSQFQDGMN